MTLLEIQKQIEKMSDSDVWSLFGFVRQLLAERKLVRTKNIVGERGEFLAIETYKNIAGLSNLQAAPEGTQNVDALSRKGERYSIKTITLPNKTTGVFYGIGELGTDEYKKKFEYLLIVVIDNHFNLNKIFELTWDQFIKYKKWHKTMRAWNISLTKELISDVKLIFEK